MNAKLTSIVCLCLVAAFVSISVMDCKPLPVDEEDEEDDDPRLDIAELEAAMDDELVHKLRPKCHQEELKKSVELEVAEVESLYEKILAIHHSQPGLYEMFKGSLDLFKSELEGYKSNPQLRRNAIKKHSGRVCHHINSLFKFVENTWTSPTGSIEKTYDIPQLRAALKSKTLVKLGQQCQRKSPFQVTQTTIRAAYPELYDLAKNHELASFVQDSFSWFKSEMKKASQEGSPVDKSEVIADHSERVCEILNKMIEISNSLDKAKVEEISSPSQY